MYCVRFLNHRHYCLNAIILLFPGDDEDAAAATPKIAGANHHHYHFNHHRLKNNLDERNRYIDMQHHTSYFTYKYREDWLELNASKTDRVSDSLERLNVTSHLIFIWFYNRGAYFA